MFAEAKRVYAITRKKHDLLFNLYVMRPLAAVIVALLARSPVTPNQLTLLNLFIFGGASAVLAGYPSYAGGLAGIALLEISYAFDCADGMLARYRKTASKTGHLFDFFTDELKAELLVAAVAIRLYRTGGLGCDGAFWPAGSPAYLLAGIVAAVVVASAISLTNFVRRPEISGRETTVEAHYETAEAPAPRSTIARIAALAMTFLRFLNHYPSHIWVFAVCARFDLFFWMYLALNLLYLGRGWLGLVLRFGRWERRAAAPSHPVESPSSP